MRRWLRRWLGIEAHESTVMQALAHAGEDITELDREIEAMQAGKKVMPMTAEDLDRSLSYFRETYLEPVAPRLTQLEHNTAILIEDQNTLRARVDDLYTLRVDPAMPEVEEPAVCPFCAHDGLVIAAVQCRVDRNHPERTEVIGYGLACGKCKRGFYGEITDRGWRTRAADAKADEVSTPAVDDEEPKAPRRAEPRFRRVRP